MNTLVGIQKATLPMDMVLTQIISLAVSLGSFLMGKVVLKLTGPQKYLMMHMHVGQSGTMTSGFALTSISFSKFLVFFKRDLCVLQHLYRFQSRLFYNMKHKSGVCHHQISKLLQKRKKTAIPFQIVSCNQCVGLFL